MEPRVYSNLSPKRGWSWETVPEPVPETQIVDTLEADVAIIGGGISGLAAGARCAELGMSAIIVDRFSESAARGELIAALDSPAMRHLGINIDKKQFARDWMSVSGSRVNEDLLGIYVNRSGEALQWLLSLAGDSVEVNIQTGYKGPGFGEYPCAHLIQLKNGCHDYINHSGGKLIRELLEQKFLNNGGRIFRCERAEQLEKNGTGRVNAFIAKGEDGQYRRYKGSKAVILAAGDISGDPEMLEAFCPVALKTNRILYRPAGLNTGDGHKMAYWAGAAFDDPAWAPSFVNSAYCEYTFFFLHVNQRGKRFMNEDTHMHAKALRCLMQPGGDHAYTIMDSKWLQEYTERFDLIGGRGVKPLSLSTFGDKWSPDCGLEQYIEKAVEGGIGVKAGTLEELAERISVPANELVKTVDRYNELVKNGEDADFGKRSELLTNIVKPPFYALKWGPELMGVFGGVLTNTNMNALGPDMKPIDGLYAVGSVSGGIYGVDYPPLIEGINYGRALTWALAAADGIRADSSGRTCSRKGVGDGN